MSTDDDDRLALDAWTAPPPPADLADRVLTAVHGRAAVESPPRPARWKRGALIGGALLAVAAIVTFAVWPAAAPDRHGQLTASAPSLVALDDDVEAMVETGAHLSWQSARGGLVVRHDAGIVTYRHRGDHRLEVVTPAGALISTRAAFRVEAPMKRDVIVGGSSAAVAALVVVAVYQGRVQAREPSRAPVTIEAGQQLALGTRATPTTPPRPVAVAKATIDRARRAALVQAIAAARQTPRPAGGAVAPAPSDPTGNAIIGVAPPADDTPGVLTKQEIREGVKEIVPMLTECYENQLEAHPGVRGTVKAKLTIDSEPDLGTVVAVNGLEIEGALGPASDLDDCLTATLEAMVLPPIADGGHLDVTYPFTFSENADAPPPPPPTQPTITERRAPKASDKIDLPAPVAPQRSAYDLANDASAAAMAGQWARALKLAEDALAAPDAASSRTKAITVAALASCNLRNEKKARKYYAMASASAQTMLAQRCKAVAHIDFDR